MLKADAGPAIAIMAAGASSRFGGDKLGAMCSGKPLVQWAVGTAAATGAAIYVVTGGSARAPIDASVCVLTNPNPAAGLGSSVRIAAAATLKRGHRQLVVILADMPLISRATLERLIGSPGPLAASRYPDGSGGVPAMFRGAAMTRLLALDPGAGARALLQNLPKDQLLDVHPRELLDVDTPAMLCEAEAALRASMDR